MTSPQFVAPNFAIVDEEIQIKVIGLAPKQPVTVSAFLHYRKHRFIGFGHFYADNDGKIDLAKNASLDGTYTGVKAMGIFSSAQGLVGRNGVRRLIVMDASEELNYELAAWPGHLSFNFFHKYGHYHDILPRNEILCKSEIVRSYIAPGVRRISIKDPCPIRGTLFIPPGPGPFPAVIDMFGGIGNCVEIRAALYAKRGYIALALGYINFSDLPAKRVNDIKFSYFTKAIDFLLAHPKANPQSVGLVCTCLSSGIGLNLALRDPRVKISIVVNTSAFVNLDPKAEYLFPVQKNVVLEPETHNFQDGFMKLIRTDGVQPHPYIVANAPLNHAHDTKIIYLVGENDIGMPSAAVAEFIQGHFIRNGRGNQVEIFKIPHQGHLIEPPYMPLADVVPLTTYVDVMINYGGEQKYHLESQLQAWNTLTGLLSQHLGTPASKL